MSLQQPNRYPVHFYSSKDKQAPILEDVDGSIKAILKACLIEGYGDKQGAGWTLAFEDDFACVLRMPKRTGNPPDIKIENGVINGKARHKITSYQFETCTGLDDSNEIASVNLLARDRTCGEQWYLVACDVGFIFCYQMGENGYGRDSSKRNHALYIGEIQKLKDSEQAIFIATQSRTVNDSGIGSVWLNALIHQYTMIKNLNTNELLKGVDVIDVDINETESGDYLAQPVLVGKKGYYPFYCAVSKRFDNVNHDEVMIDNRPMLRFVNRLYQNYGNKALYIPLDFWEI